MRMDRKMGERARTALERLISDTVSLRHSRADPEDLFRAGVRILMRLVVLFFAESRGLLPVRNQVFATSYSITRLTRTLEEAGRRSPGSLAGSFFAWPRILSLFRLVFDGSPHPGLPVRAYGGELFEPGTAGEPGIGGAVALFEEPGAGPDDAAVAAVLQLLARRGQRAGRNSQVDFSALPGDYLGTIYEALLDCRLERTSTWHLARHGGTRKASGSYYTPAALAARVVEHTLEPLCYEGSRETPRHPEEILALRLCDPAMGSGAFLVAALRYLTNAILAGVNHRCLSRPLVGGGTAVDLGGTCIELPCRPGEEGCDSLLEAHVRRHVVERCLHGVDRDPVTVELARIALWLETMDHRLPFTFLDHKLKVGDALVGAWFHDLEVYPLQAWRRSGDDEAGQDSGRAGSGSASEFKKRALAATTQLACLTAEARSPLLPFPDSAPTLPKLRRTLARTMEGLYRLPVQLPDRKREHYRLKYLESEGVGTLKAALDRWCALWFWPSGNIANAPSPKEYLSSPARPGGPAAAIAAQERFFHWELEFPEVFARSRRGFDVMLGNPPWDTVKGRRDLSNWFANAREPGGGMDRALRCAARGGKRESNVKQRRRRPFQLQGRGDFNTHKLFLEQALYLTRDGGRLGLLLPGGLYTDRGCRRLREELLDRCQWEWLFSFENRRKLFPIDGRFRFAAVVVRKGGRTKVVRAAFMRRRPDEWVAESDAVFDYPAALLEKLNHKERAFMEVTSKRQLALVERMNSAGVPLAGRGRESWQVRYHREIDAGWKPEAEAEVRPGALPFYQGAMIGQFDFAAAPAGMFMDASAYAAHRNARLEPKVVVRRITNATNSRTVIASLVPGHPCNDKLPVLSTGSPARDLALLALLNSFAFDYAARTLCATANLDWHLLGRLPLPRRPAAELLDTLALAALRLNGSAPLFAGLWLEMARRQPALKEHPWQAWWAQAREQRASLRVLIDVLAASAFGLTADDMEFVLADCNHPVGQLKKPSFTSTLEPRGFWRVDRDEPPGERLPVRVLAACRAAPTDSPASDRVLLPPVPAGACLDWDDCRRLALRQQELVAALEAQTARPLPLRAKAEA